MKSSFQSSIIFFAVTTNQLNRNQIKILSFRAKNARIFKNEGSFKVNIDNLFISSINCRTTKDSRDVDIQSTGNKVICAFSGRSKDMYVAAIRFINMSGTQLRVDATSRIQKLKIYQDSKIANIEILDNYIVIDCFSQLSQDSYFLIYKNDNSDNNPYLYSSIKKSLYTKTID